MNIAERAKAVADEAVRIIEEDEYLVSLIVMSWSYGASERTAREIVRRRLGTKYTPRQVATVVHLVVAGYRQSGAPSAA